MGADRGQAGRRVGRCRIEDEVGRDGGAGRLVIAARFAGDRAIGSAHDDAELEALKAAAGQRIAAGQTEPGLGLGDSGAAGPLPITSSRMGCLLDALDRGYRVLGLDEAAGGDGVFRQLVLARIIEPASKIDSFESTQAGNVGSAACAS
jgi:hypothetical protein